MDLPRVSRRNYLINGGIIIIIPLYDFAGIFMV